MNILTIIIGIIVIGIHLLAIGKFLKNLDSSQWANPKEYYKHDPY